MTVALRRVSADPDRFDRLDHTLDLVGSGMPLREVAGDLGVTVERVRQVTVQAYKERRVPLDPRDRCLSGYRFNRVLW